MLLTTGMLLNTSQKNLYIIIEITIERFDLQTLKLKLTKNNKYIEYNSLSNCLYRIAYLLY